MRPHPNIVRHRLNMRSPNQAPVVCVLVAILLANLAPLLHLVTSNPLALDASLLPPQRGLLPGVPSVDPNGGYTAQALGHLAALEWFHAHVPWWNPYEGIGTPLAAEMQSGAFFPPTILLLFHDGTLYLQILLEATSGWSTYFLVRRLGIGRSVSIAAGTAFGLCGTFAWFDHAPIRPVALLPLSLIGIEQILDAAKERRAGGWHLLAVALALSVLAGFPETAFIDGLFVIWWCILRVAGAGRAVWSSVGRKVVLGFAVGIALAAPLIVAFLEYLGDADLVSHSQGFTHLSLPNVGWAQLILPYALGPPSGLSSANGADTIQSLWGGVGGFLTATLIAGAFVGIVGRRHRGLRFGLAGWVLLFLSRSFGFPPVVHLIALVPGARSIAFFRYSDPSWELAVVALAALGLDDIARNLTKRSILVAASTLTGSVAAWAAFTAWPVVRDATANPANPGQHSGSAEGYLLGSLVGALAALTCLAVGGWWSGSSVSHRTRHPRHTISTERIRSRGRLVVMGIVMGESVVLLGFTYFSAPTPKPLQLSSVRWLQDHLRTSRFVTLGPIQPNYGSYFGISQANINDVPLPKTFSNDVGKELDPNAPAGLFTGGARINPNKLSPAQELAAHLTSYEAIGVRYVIEHSDGLDLQGHAFPPAGSPPWPSGPRLVHRDSFAEIWELPSAASLYSVSSPTTPTNTAMTGPPCSTSGAGWDDITTECREPAMVIRRVQYMPGWTVTGNGRPLAIVMSTGVRSGLFQQIDVPSGRTELRFTFVPPHEDIAVAIAVAALIGLVASFMLAINRNRGRPVETTPSSLPSDPISSQVTPGRSEPALAHRDDI